MGRTDSLEKTPDVGNVGNLIPGSSAFSKTSLNIWKFMVHILLKPGLENFECPEEHQPWVATGTAQEHVWLCQQLMGGPCQPLRPTPSGTAPPGQPSHSLLSLSPPAFNISQH